MNINAVIKRCKFTLIILSTTLSSSLPSSLLPFSSSSLFVLFKCEKSKGNKKKENQQHLLIFNTWHLKHKHRNKMSIKVSKFTRTFNYRRSIYVACYMQSIELMPTCNFCSHFHSLFLSITQCIMCYTIIELYLNDLFRQNEIICWLFKRNTFIFQPLSVWCQNDT